MYRNAYPWTLTAAKGEWPRTCATTRTRLSAAGASSWRRACAAGARPPRCGASSTTCTRSCVRAMSGADEQASGELRAALTELSRSRARNGFTPTETALGVFALKDAVYELVADTADLVPEYLAFSRMIGRSRPAYVRDLRGGQGADHRRPGRGHARAVHPGDQAVGRHHRGAAGRRARLGTHPADHGEAAGDPGRDRRGSRRAGHHRGGHGGHRGGPAPAQDGECGAAARGRMHHQRHQAAGGADDRVARHRVRRHRHQGDAGRRAGARADAAPDRRSGPA